MNYIKDKKRGKVYYPEIGKECNGYITEIVFTGEDYVDVTFKDSSGRVDSMLSLSKNWVYFTVTSDIESIVVKVLNKKAEAVSNGYKITDFNGSHVIISRFAFISNGIFKSKLVLESNNLYFSFIGVDDSVKKIFSKLGDWWS